MGWCCMYRLGRDLKGQYLFCTILVLHILIKYKSDLQRNILGTAVPSSIPPFSILLAPPSGLCGPCQWRFAVPFKGTVGRTSSTHIQHTAFSMCASLSKHLQQNLWEKLQWELAALNYFQDFDLLVKTPVWRKLLWGLFSSAVLDLAPILKELFADENIVKYTKKMLCMVFKLPLQLIPHFWGDRFLFSRFIFGFYCFGDMFRVKLQAVTNEVSDVFPW